jgi:hypothetical protein
MTDVIIENPILNSTFSMQWYRLTSNGDRASWGIN